MKILLIILVNIKNFTAGDKHCRLKMLLVGKVDEKRGTSQWRKTDDRITNKRKESAKKQYKKITVFIIRWKSELLIGIRIVGVFYSDIRRCCAGYFNF